MARSLVLGVQGYDPRRMMIFMRLFHKLDRVGEGQKTIPEELTCREAEHVEP